ncbi:MAG: hypothetical protein RMI90_16690, partial [Thermoguttaceae bacterium]|nr:hypothetical protein [Thermoguttaceae bacterium]
GFETSANCVYELLEGAIRRIHEETDTFPISGLSSVYRRTLFSTGTWWEAIAKLLQLDTDWREQFRRLSELLQRINARLVFVVEDLDRSASPNFHISEVTGLLQQLKEYPHVQFILTAAPQATKEIDFPRLCEHIEHLRPLSIDQVARVVREIREKCLDRQKYSLHPSSLVLDNPWERNWVGKTTMLLTPGEALAIVLSTPRFLKHALRRTLWAWGWPNEDQETKKHKLAGELKWDSLLALNALRGGAPEAFSFLERRWDRLRREFTQQSEGTREEERTRVQEDWKATVEKVDWDVRAVRELIDFILPHTPQWLDSKNESSVYGQLSCPQGLWKKRYWYRAINEWLGPSQIRDQMVLQDIQNWLNTHQSRLIEQLQTSNAYPKVFARWAVRVFPEHLEKVPQLVSELHRAIESSLSAHSKEEQNQRITRFITVVQTMANLGWKVGKNKPLQQRRNQLVYTWQTVGNILWDAIQNGSLLATIAFAKVYLRSTIRTCPRERSLTVFGKSTLLEIIQTIKQQIGEAPGSSKIPEDLYRKVSNLLATAEQWVQQQPDTNQAKTAEGEQKDGGVCDDGAAAGGGGHAP